MPLFAATALFIGHHLVLPADMERRWIAAFPTYFDTAWKAGVQLALSIGFTTFVLTTIGMLIGKAVGARFGKIAEFFGGVALIVIGASILAEHMGWLA